MTCRLPVSIIVYTMVLRSTDTDIPSNASRIIPSAAKEVKIIREKPEVVYQNRQSIADKR
ncbi:MAG: hypothetical protein WBH01_06310 [Dehalococcoidia bacterium]